MRLLLVLALLVPRTAAACPEDGYGSALARAIAKAFDSDRVPVSAPLVIPAIGASIDGLHYGVSVGWGWGERQIGGLFPGVEIRRVLVTVRRPFDGAFDDGTAARSTMQESTASPDTHVALTYGWFGSVPKLLDAGLDLGLAGTSPSRFGPHAQVTGGMGGLGIRLAAGVELGSSARVTASAELVLDLMVLARAL